MLYSFILYYIAFFSISAVEASPLAFLDMSAETMALFQFLALIVSIAGGFITVGLSLKNDANNKFNEQNKKIDKVEDKVEIVDKKIDIRSGEIKEEMHKVEKRIVETTTQKTGYLAETIEERIKSAKILEDERIANLSRRVDNLEHEERK